MLFQFNVKSLFKSFVEPSTGSPNLSSARKKGLLDGSILLVANSLTFSMVFRKRGAKQTLSMGAFELVLIHLSMYHIKQMKWKRRRKREVVKIKTYIQTKTNLLNTQTSLIFSIQLFIPTLLLFHKFFSRFTSSFRFALPIKFFFYVGGLS